MGGSTIKTVVVENVVVESGVSAEFSSQQMLNNYVIIGYIWDFIL